MKKAVYWAQISGAREYQEDYAITQGGGENADSDYMLLICDGMGGHAAGDVASKMAARTFLAVFNERGASDPRDWLPRALSASNTAIADAVAQDESLANMGTTLLACIISENTVTWISVGDSPMFHIRKSKLALWNDDHSMAPLLDQLASDGQISPEEARRDPRRNALRSAIMGDEIPLVDLQQKEEVLKPGDVLVLASDGILSLARDEIAKVTARSLSGGAKAIGDALLKAIDAKRLPHQDNATVAVYVHKQDKMSGFFRSILGP